MAEDMITVVEVVVGIRKRDIDLNKFKVLIKKVDHWLTFLILRQSNDIRIEHTFLNQKNYIAIYSGI